MQIIEKGTLKILIPSTGYQLHKIDTDIYSLKVYLGINDSMDNYEEIELPSYIKDYNTIDEMKTVMIQLTKLNLATFLENNPLFSKAKYEEGRYYKVTSEKQQQLTSKILMYEGYSKIGMDYELTWNDVGEICEKWEYRELFQLSMEIDAYVTPLVKLQQTKEVQIRKAQSVDELLKIDLDFSLESLYE